MKKSHIAAAVLAALPFGAAVAQNVTVYGVLDTAVQGYDNGVAGSTTQGSITRVVDSALTTSRLGFRGSEDLGGGLKAEFQLEMRVDTSNGTAGTDLFNRAAWVGISGGFGSVKVGRVDTLPSNVDITVSQAGNLGNHGATRATATTTQGIDSVGDKVANVLVYTTPTIQGLSAELHMGNYSSAAKINNNTTEGTGIAVNYQAGPLRAIVAASSIDVAAGADKKQQSYGASYDAGVFSVGVARASLDQNTAAANDKLTSTIGSVAVPLGGGLTAHGVIGRMKGEGNTNNKAAFQTLAVSKALSKRTTVYGAYSSLSNDDGGQFTTTGFTNANTTSDFTAGTDANFYAVGIRHSF